MRKSCVKQNHFFAVTITTSPSSVNTSANKQVTFDCAAENANLFFWYLNDTYVKYLSHVDSDIETNDTDTPPSSRLRLDIPKNFGQLNESWIKCKATYFDGLSDSTPAVSAEALLLIQGTGALKTVKIRIQCT